MAKKIVSWITWTPLTKNQLREQQNHLEEFCKKHNFSSVEHGINDPRYDAIHRYPTIKKKP